MSVACTARSEEETRRLGAALGRVARAGDVVGLCGPLGAGKTCFVQGMAVGLGVARPAEVLSPSFALVQEHEGRVRLIHVDLYRLERAEELVELGLRDYYYASDGVCAVEWMDRFAEARPAEGLEVRVAFGDGDERRIEAVPIGERGAALARAWQRALGSC